MGQKMTSATPARLPRSRSRFTRATRRWFTTEGDFDRRPTIERQMREAMYGYPEYDARDDFEDDRCDRCGGEGVIEYAEGGPEVWGEDCPSEVNHMVTCPDCGGNG